jgi:hypothetical protein
MPELPRLRGANWVERVAPTERDAKAKLKELRREFERGVFTPGGEQPLAAYLEWWLDTSVRPHRTPKTVVGYETNVNRHIAPRLGAVRRLASSDHWRWVSTPRRRRTSSWITSSCQRRTNRLRIWAPSAAGSVHRSACGSNAPAGSRMSTLRIGTGGRSL